VIWREKELLVPDVDNAEEEEECHKILEFDTIKIDFFSKKIKENKGNLAHLQLLDMRKC